MSSRTFDVAAGSPATPPTRDEVARLFDDHVWGRYCADWSLPRAGARAIERDALLGLLSRPSSVVFYATATDDPSSLVGVLVAARSEWDTDFWGIDYVSIDALHVVGGSDDVREEIAGALLDEFRGWCAAERVRFVCTRVETLDLAVIHAVESRGFRYIETTLTNAVDLRTKQFSLPPGYEIRAPRPDETPLLVDMTVDAFLTHRFYADPGFPKAKVDEMYRRWVESSLESPAWTTIVLDLDGVAHGFFIYRIEDHREQVGVRITKWRMGVLGVESRASGHGVALFEGAMDHVGASSEIVDSGLSLRNLKSFNLHTKLGFRGLSFSATYHQWL
ncbi:MULTISPECIES: hypothetical protein [unclassified Nocardioides]|uniref:hypothetical protein n=1 Tax=unclassified Nocardioides TaxID=2615069 RepID=UPI000AD27360|nr:MULTISPECIES: hypothetical protein [unclassified Nocardioides]